jgi:hypothetical protein
MGRKATKTKKNFVEICTLLVLTLLKGTAVVQIEARK